MLCYKVVGQPCLKVIWCGRSLPTKFLHDTTAASCIPQNGCVKQVTQPTCNRHCFGKLRTGNYCAEFDLRQPFELTIYCSVFQAEIFVVRKAAEIVNTAVSQAAISSHCIASENVFKSGEVVDLMTLPKVTNYLKVMPRRIMHILFTHLNSTTRWL